MKLKTIDTLKRKRESYSLKNKKRKNQNQRDILGMHYQCMPPVSSKPTTVGITLVALVVTIVVLLILAGITLVYVFGGNGVFGKAVDAKVQTELGKIEEQASIIYSDKLIEKKNGKIDEISNKDIIDELISEGNQIEIRNIGSESIKGISLEPEVVSMDKSQTVKIKVKLEIPEDGNLYYVIVDGKYYEINFQNSQLKINRKSVMPEGTTEKQTNIEIETGYNATIVTNVTINQNEKTMEIASGTTYGQTTLAVKYGSKTATCNVKVEEAESNWKEIAEIAKLIAKDQGRDENNQVVSSNSSQATVTLNGESKTIKVGEIYKLRYDGIIKRIRVLGFKHDELVNTGIYGSNHSKAGISFEFLDFMTGNSYKVMNSTNTNSGGWANTQMRKDLNGYTTNAKEQNGAIGGLGAKLGNERYIKQVKKRYIETYNQASTNNNYTNDYLWLLAASEVVNEGYQSGAYGYAITSEGSQYKYYQGVTEAWNLKSMNRQKYNASGSTYRWWLRSPHGFHSGYFCYIEQHGEPTAGSYQSPFSHGVAPGFAI